MDTKIVKMSDVTISSEGIPNRKGYPRPQVLFDDNLPEGRISTIDPDDIRGKVYPVPYTAAKDSLADVDHERYAECRQDQLCLVCGLHVESARFFAIWDSQGWGRFDGGYHHSDAGGWSDEPGPFHDKCARLTFSKCPAFRFTKNDRYQSVLVPEEHVPYLMTRMFGAKK